MELSKKIILIIFLLFTVFVEAETDFFDKVKEKYDTIQTYEADFIQKTYYEEIGEEMIFNGKIFYTNNKAALFYNEPKDQFIIYDSEKLRIYDPAAKQLIVSVPDESTKDLKPINILETYWDKSTREVKEVNGKIEIVLDVKNDPELDVIYVTINSNSFLIEKMKYTVSNNKVEYIFNNHRVNKDLDKSVFEYELPEGTTIIQR